MFELVAQIDSLDSRYFGEFQTIMENETGDTIKNWLLKNCGVKHETEDFLTDDVIIQSDEYLITYRDIMCETVSLYLL